MFSCKDLSFFFFTWSANGLNSTYWILHLFPTDLKCHIYLTWNSYLHESASALFVLFHWLICLFLQLNQTGYPQSYKHVFAHCSLGSEVPCHLSSFANALGNSKVPDEFPNNFVKHYALQSPTVFSFYFDSIQRLDTIERIDNFIFLFNFNSIPCTLFHLQSLFFLIIALPISCELHLRYLTVLLLLRKVFF